jgi:adenylate cyclase class IV
VNLVHYVVFGANMERMGSFIEVEVNKPQVARLGADVYTVLRDWEKRLEGLGISAKKRIKRSLFEMYYV